MSKLFAMLQFAIAVAIVGEAPMPRLDIHATTSERKPSGSCPLRTPLRLPETAASLSGYAVATAAPRFDPYN